MIETIPTPLESALTPYEDKLLVKYTGDFGRDFHIAVVIKSGKHGAWRRSAHGDEHFVDHGLKPGTDILVEHRRYSNGDLGGGYALLNYFDVSALYSPVVNG